MFSVQYTTKSSARRCNQSNVLEAGASVFLRDDLPMDLQEMSFEMHQTKLAKAWAKKNAPKQRSFELETLALNTLVVEAVRRQHLNGSTTLAAHISRFINPVKKPTGEEEKRVSSPCPSPDPEEDSEEVIYDLSFIQAKLLEDVAILHDAHGFEATLRAFHSFNPWKI